MPDEDMEGVQGVGKSTCTKAGRGFGPSLSFSEETPMDAEMFIKEIQGIMHALLVRGIWLGIVFSIVSALVFWRTLISMITTPTVVDRGPFMVRFLEGVGVGVGIMSALFFGAWYALQMYGQHLANQSPTIGS
jgi:hypothetical protein